MAALLAAVFALCAYAFLWAAHGLDRALLFGLPAPFEVTAPRGPRRLVKLSWELSSLGSPGVVAAITAVVGGLLFVARRPGPALLLTGSVGSGTVFGYVLKRAFGALRPHDLSLPHAELSTSFPSGHAFLVALLGASLVHAVCPVASPADRTRLTWYAVSAGALLSAAVGLSRVHLGLHWPTDVVAGWIAGAGWAVFFAATAKWVVAQARASWCRSPWRTATPCRPAS
jgi:undecaprenyl-diphosphatase